MRCSNVGVVSKCSYLSRGSYRTTARCILPAGHDGVHMALNDDGESYVSWGQPERDDAPSCWCAVCNPDAGG